MLPTFICVGAAKTGTTTLQKYLEAHPEVCLSLFKEPDFFHNEAGVMDGGKPDGPPSSGHYARGLDWYQSIFQPNQTTRAVGEISTAYIAIEDAPRLIRKDVPDVRLIFCLRDPATRLYSHYWEERKAGWELPPFEMMLRSRHPRFNYYFHVSSYHLHLIRYLEFFPKEQILVTLFDDLYKDPKQFIQDVYRFIGVDAAFIPPNLGEKYNPAQQPKSPSFQRLLTRLAAARWEMTSNFWLYEWLAIVGRWLVRLNSQPITYAPLPSPLRSALIEEFSETIDFVETYLNRQLPAWRNVN
jgi:hypothetical protein